MGGDGSSGNDFEARKVCWLLLTSETNRIELNHALIDQSTGTWNCVLLHAYNMLVARASNTGVPTIWPHVVLLLNEECSKHNRLQRGTHVDKKWDESQHQVVLSHNPGDILKLQNHKPEILVVFTEIDFFTFQYSSFPTLSHQHSLLTNILRKAQFHKMVFYYAVLTLVACSFVSVQGQTCISQTTTLALSDFNNMRAALIVAFDPADNPTPSPTTTQPTSATSAPTSTAPTSASPTSAAPTAAPLPPSTASPTPPPSTSAPTTGGQMGGGDMGGNMGGGMGGAGGGGMGGGGMMGGRNRRQGGMGGDMGGGQLPIEDLTAGDIVGGIVRLAFHDAAGFVDGLDDGFGVDGCVDATNGDNAGLSESIALLETLRAPFCHLISRADFWVLAAYTAVEARAPPQYISPTFQYGRSDNDVCSDFVGSVSRLPSANKGTEEIDRVFVNAMGLTRADAVALLGAHTLGRAETANSGFNGPWTANPGQFNNGFYNNLVDRPWNRQTVPGGTQWRLGPTIMLNADMELAYNVVDAAGNLLPGINRCGPVANPDDCTRSGDFSNLATTFANNQQAFFSAFSTSLQRMVEVGYGTGLSEVTGVTRRSIRGRKF